MDNARQLQYVGAEGTIISYDDEGNLIPQVYKEKTRTLRHKELVEYSVSGAIEQAKIARDIAGNDAAIHVNILWEMGAAETILSRTLEKANGVSDCITRITGASK